MKRVGWAGESGMGLDGEEIGLSSGLSERVDGAIVGISAESSCEFSEDLFVISFGITRSAVCSCIDGFAGIGGLVSTAVVDASAGKDGFGVIVGLATKKKDFFV